MLGRKALEQTAHVAAVTVSPELRRTSRVHTGPAEWRPAGPPHHQIDQVGIQQHNASHSLGGHQPQPDGGLSGFDIAYDELMDMDAVFGDFLNMNLPDFGMPFQ